MYLSLDLGSSSQWSCVKKIGWTKQVTAYIFRIQSLSKLQKCGQLECWTPNGNGGFPCLPQTSFAGGSVQQNATQNCINAPDKMCMTCPPSVPSEGPEPPKDLYYSLEDTSGSTGAHLPLAIQGPSTAVQVPGATRQPGTCQWVPNGHL